MTVPRDPSGAKVTINPDRLFWADLLDEMKAAGFSYEKIGKQIGCDQSTVFHWKTGGSAPMFWHAIDLLALARKHGIPSADEKIARLTDRMNGNHRNR